MGDIKFYYLTYADVANNSIDNETREEMDLEDEYVEFDHVEAADILLCQYIKNGWDYDCEAEHLTDQKVTDDSGKVWTLEEVLNKLNGPLDFGDTEQEKAQEVFRFYNILFNHSYEDTETLEKQGLF